MIIVFGKTVISLAIIILVSVIVAKSFEDIEKERKTTNNEKKVIAVSNVIFAISFILLFFVVVSMVLFTMWFI